jgi:hypothetical protein
LIAGKHIISIESPARKEELILMCPFDDRTPKKPGVEHNFDPSMHIFPLAPAINVPVMLGTDEQGTGTLVALTTDGRISFFPAKLDQTKQKIHRRIGERFPSGKDTTGQIVNQYVCVGVVYGARDAKQARFIFEVWGFKDPFKELEHLFSALYSIGGRTVGDKHYKAIEADLSSEPVRSWINALIAFLKEQIGWADYVRKALDTEPEPL